MTRNVAFLGLAVLAAAGLTACSGGSGDSVAPGPNLPELDTGKLSIGLIDMPVRGVEEVWVCITQINVKPASGRPLEFPFPDAAGSCDGRQFDLLSLQDIADAARLIDGEEVPAGPYIWMELELDAAKPGQGADADGPMDSYVVAGGNPHPLLMPSGSVRLFNDFVVAAGQHTRFTLDWNTHVGLSGIVDPQGQEGYILRPTFRVIDEMSFGTLRGTITNEFMTDPANACNIDSDHGSYDAGNVIYLFERNQTPDDMDADGPDPYATVMVMPNDDFTAYVYETIVEPGDYELVFTCQGDNDEPGTDDNNGAATNVEFHPVDGVSITITEGETTTVDFPQPADPQPLPLPLPAIAPATLELITPTVNPGGSVTVNLVGGPGGAEDLLTLAAVGSLAGEFLNFTFVGDGVTDRDWMVDAPPMPGEYEFRFFVNNDFSEVIAVSAVLTVEDPAPTSGVPTLTLSAATVNPGNPVTVTLTDGPGSGLDLLTLAAADSPSNSYIDFSFVRDGATDHRWTINAPTTLGQYEFRLFLNREFAQLVTVSETLTVEVTP